MADSSPEPTRDGGIGASVEWDEDLPPEDLSRVRDLFSALAKAVRAHQLYDENNPVYDRFVTGLRRAFDGLWEGKAERLPIQVEEERLVWRGEEVYRAEKRSDSLAFLFFKDGVRKIVFYPGIEGPELLPFLEVLHRARNLRPEGDDLLTILWEEDLQTFDYEYVDLLEEGLELPEAGPGHQAGELRTVLESEGLVPGPEDEEGEVGAATGLAPAPGQVSAEDFNPTLYSLDSAELERLQKEVDAEMGRDLRRSVLEALFDRVEEPEHPVRQEEILRVFRTLLPNFLSRGVLRPAAAVLHEVQALLGAEGILEGPRREQAKAVVEEASAPETVHELVRALVDGTIRDDPQSLAVYLQFLEARALAPLIRASEELEERRLREMLREAVEAIARRHGADVVELLGHDDPVVVAGAVRLVGRMELQNAAARLGRLVGHRDPRVRIAVADAAVEVRASTVASALVRALDDDDREVRIAAARALGELGYAPAAPRFREILESKAIRKADVSEIIAFFESYGALGDDEAVDVLDGLLNGRSFLGRREPDQIRAAAALALGRIGGSGARKVLERARGEEEPVVRSAVNRALRGESEGVEG